VPETGRPDEQKTDHGPDDEANGLGRGEKPHGLGPPRERGDIGHIGVGRRGVAAQPKAVHDPPDHQERDRAGQQVEHARQSIAGCADENQGPAAPGVGQPAHNRAEEEGRQGESAGHQAGIGLASPQVDDINGQRGDQHLHAESVGEVGQRCIDEVRRKKAILNPPVRGCLPGAAPANRSAIAASRLFLCVRHTQWPPLSLPAKYRTGFFMRPRFGGAGMAGPILPVNGYLEHGYHLEK